MSPEYLKNLAKVSRLVFNQTGIYSAYTLTANVNYLLFWAYTVSFLPLAIGALFVWWLCIENVGERLLQLKSVPGRVALGSALLVALELVLMYAVQDTYLGTNFIQIFPPNIIGCLTYAFAFQYLLLFSVVPFFKLMLVFSNSRI